LPIFPSILIIELPLPSSKPMVVLVLVPSPLPQISHDERRVGAGNCYLCILQISVVCLALLLLFHSFLRLHCHHFAPPSLMCFPPPALPWKP
jgi:hypothetical protein